MTTEWNWKDDLKEFYKEYHYAINSNDSEYLIRSLKKNIENYLDHYFISVDDEGYMDIYNLYELLDMKNL